MRASSIAIATAILMGLIGMGWGIYMAISQDHSTSPAHAHLNLLGWVSLFVIGLFYRHHPALDVSLPARLQTGVWIAASIGMVIGIGLIYSGRPAAEPIAAISSIIMFADMAFFGWLAIRTLRSYEPAAIPAPAE